MKPPVRELVAIERRHAGPGLPSIDEHHEPTAEDVQAWLVAHPVAGPWAPSDILEPEYWARHSLAGPVGSCHATTGHGQWAWWTPRASERRRDRSRRRHGAGRPGPEARWLRADRRHAMRPDETDEGGYLYVAVAAWALLAAAFVAGVLVGAAVTP